MPRPDAPKNIVFAFATDWRKPSELAKMTDTRKPEDLIDNVTQLTSVAAELLIRAGDANYVWLATEPGKRNAYTQPEAMYDCAKRNGSVNNKLGAGLNLDTHYSGANSQPMKLKAMELQTKLAKMRGKEVRTILLAPDELLDNLSATLREQNLLINKKESSQAVVSRLSHLLGDQQDLWKAKLEEYDASWTKKIRRVKAWLTKPRHL